MKGWKEGWRAYLSVSGDGHLQVLVLVEVIRRSVSLPVEEARVERSMSAWSREEEMRRGGGYEENKGRKKRGGKQKWRKQGWEK